MDLTLSAEEIAVGDFFDLAVFVSGICGFRTVLPCLHCDKDTAADEYGAGCCGDYACHDALTERMIAHCDILSGALRFLLCRFECDSFCCGSRLLLHAGFLMQLMFWLCFSDIILRDMLHGIQQLFRLHKNPSFSR